MTLIEGVGDEVTDFFIVVVVLLVGWLAWCSTSITDQPLIRTVLILQHRTRTRIAALRADRQSASSPSRPPNFEISEEELVEPTSDENNDTTSSCPQSSVTDTTAEIPPETNRTSEPTATEEVLIEAMDSFNNDNATTLQRQTKINASEASGIPTPTCTNTMEHTTENVTANDANEISIKLKFINDDEKLVTGSLKELLSEFRRRHFQIELEAQKLVRFIFNGRILQPDNQTLERCGLYNNCVVHCLVHQARPNAVSPPSSIFEDRSTSRNYNYNGRTLDEIRGFSDTNTPEYIPGPRHNEWDLSRLLLSILTLMLSLAWYLRYHYAQLFTATTTLALYVLTAIFTASFAGNLHLI